MGKDEREDGESAVGGRMIEGRTALTVEDFSSAWRFLPQIRSTIAIGIWVAVAMPIFACTTSGWMGGTAWLYGVGGLVTALALAFGLVRGRAQWARSALKTLRGEEGVLFRFDDHGFLLKSPGRESVLAWDTLHRCIETVPAFLIYTAPQVVAVVPKRAFSAADQADLQALLRERIRPAPLAGVFRPGRALLLWLVLIVAFLAIWQLFNAK
jgi:hypothetical protein